MGQLSYHHFQDFLFFFTLKIVLNDIGCMFEVVVLLQNKFGSNHTYLQENCSHHLMSRVNNTLQFALALSTDLFALQAYGRGLVLALKWCCSKDLLP